LFVDYVVRSIPSTRGNQIHRKKTSCRNQQEWSIMETWSQSYSSKELQKQRKQNDLGWEKI